MKRHIVVLAGLLVVSLATNAGLASLARLSNARVAALAELMTFTPIRTRVIPGEAAPPLLLKTLAGDAVTVQTQGASIPTVLYVFSPDCRWCRANKQSVEALINGTTGKYRFIPLSMFRQGLSSYLEDHNLGVDVFMEPSTETASAYSLGLTPMTIVVSPAGTIERVWLGAFTREVLSEMQEMFGVTLPDLPSGVLFNQQATTE